MEYQSEASRIRIVLAHGQWNGRIITNIIIHCDKNKRYMIESFYSYIRLVAVNRNDRVIMNDADDVDDDYHVAEAHGRRKNY